MEDAPDPDLARKAEPILRDIVADVKGTTGLDIPAHVRWMSPEEQRSEAAQFAAEWDRHAGQANVRHVLLGSEHASPQVLPVEEYEGFWVVELAHSITMIHDPTDVLDVIQEEVIEQLWGLGKSASWPECPEHGGHPLHLVVADEKLHWECPREPAVRATFGALSEDPRFRT